MNEQNEQRMVDSVAALLRQLRADVEPVCDIEDTRVSTWFERDRMNVELIHIDAEGFDVGTIVKWWDGDVAGAIEDGFLDPSNWHGSAYEYAHEHNMLPAGRLIDVTIASDNGLDWVWQTGDNSYTGACCGYACWGVGSVAHDDDDEACREEARRMVEQVFDGLAEMES